MSVEPMKSSNLESHKSGLHAFKSTIQAEVRANLPLRLHTMHKLMSSSILCLWLGACMHSTRYVWVRIHQAQKHLR